MAQDGIVTFQDTLSAVVRVQLSFLWKSKYRVHDTDVVQSFSRLYAANHTSCQGWNQPKSNTDVGYDTS